MTLFTYLPMKMEQTECSETSVYKIQTPGNYPEENIKHTEHGESLKSRKLCYCCNSVFREIRPRVGHQWFIVIHTYIHTIYVVGWYCWFADSLKDQIFVGDLFYHLIRQDLWGNSDSLKKWPKHGVQHSNEENFTAGFVCLWTFACSEEEKGQANSPG